MTTVTTNTPTAAPVPPTDTSNKLLAAARYLGSNATGALSLFVILGTLSPEQQTTILASAHDMYAATQSFIGAAANIWYIVFPIIAVWLGKMGYSSSGFGAMMDKIFTAAKAGNRDAQIAIVTAAASKSIGTTAIINPVLAAEPSTPANVAASVSALPIQTQGEVK